MRRLTHWSQAKINASVSEFKRSFRSSLKDSIKVATNAGKKMAEQLAHVGVAVKDLPYKPEEIELADNLAGQLLVKYYKLAPDQIEMWRRRFHVPKNRKNVMLMVAWSTLCRLPKPDKEQPSGEPKRAVEKIIVHFPRPTNGAESGPLTKERRTVRQLMFCGRPTRKGHPCRTRTGISYIGDPESGKPRPCRLHGTESTVSDSSPKSRERPVQYQLPRGNNRHRVAGMFSGYIRRQQKALRQQHKILSISTIPTVAPKRLVPHKVAYSQTRCIDIDSMFHARCDRPAAIGTVFCDVCRPKNGRP